MTIQSVLNEGFMQLSSLDIETAMLDVTVLLAEALQVSKEQLYIRFNEEIDVQQYHIFKTYLELRCTGNPVSYIRKRKEFFGIDFFVDNRVLVPRPETELLVEVTSALINNYPHFSSLHDICTGSGCVALALKIHHPHLEISASDISPQAAEVFSINCQKILGYQIPFDISNLFSDIRGKFDIITANPPYIKDKDYEEMKRLGWPEPELALRGGKDGLEISDRLVKEAVYHLNPGGFLILESAFDNMSCLHYILSKEYFSNITVKKDLANRERVIMGRWE